MSLVFLKIYTLFKKIDFFNDGFNESCEKHSSKVFWKQKKRTKVKIKNPQLVISFKVPLKKK